MTGMRNEGFIFRRRIMKSRRLHCTRRKIPRSEEQLKRLSRSRYCIVERLNARAFSSSFAFMY
jgi:hypothetical protein